MVMKILIQYKQHTEKQLRILDTDNNNNIHLITDIQPDMVIQLIHQLDHTDMDHQLDHMEMVMNMDQMVIILDMNIIMKLI